MYLFNVHSAVLRRKCKQRLSRNVYTYSESGGEFNRFPRSLCVLLLVINLVVITYNLTASAQLLGKLQTEYDVLQQRDKVVVSELRARQGLQVARTGGHRAMAESEGREGERGEQVAWPPEFHRK